MEPGLEPFIDGTDAKRATSRPSPASIGALVLLAVTAAACRAIPPPARSPGHATALPRLADPPANWPVTELWEEELVITLGPQLRQRAPVPLPAPVISIREEHLAPDLRQPWEAREERRHVVEQLNAERARAAAAIEQQRRALPPEATEEASGELWARKRAVLERFEPAIERATNALTDARVRALRAFRNHVTAHPERASASEILALSQLELLDAMYRFAETGDEPDFARPIADLGRLVQRSRADSRDEASAHFLLGYMQWVRRDYSAAAEAWEAMLALPESAGDPPRVAVGLSLARLHASNGDLDRAIALLGGVPEGHQHYDRALEELAWSHWSAGATTDARQAAVRLLARSQTDWLSLMTLRLIAQTLAAEGDDDAHSLGPDVSSPLRAAILGRLAMLLARRGLLARSRTALDAAVAIDDDTDATIPVDPQGLVSAARETLHAREASPRSRALAFVEAVARECYELEPGRHPVTVGWGDGRPEVTIDGLERRPCEPVAWDHPERVGGVVTLLIEVLI